MPKSWEEYLLSEHALIARILDVVETEIGNAESGRGDFLRIGGGLRLLLEFGDEAHNVKEENHLFPLMVERGISQSGPIHSMLMDHEAERESLVRFSTKIKDLEAGPKDELMAWIKQVSEYLATRRQHLDFEGKELYLTARSVLTDEDNKRLLQAFMKIDRTLFGGNGCEHFENVVQEIEKKTSESKAFGGLLSSNEMKAIFDTLSLKVAFVEESGRIVFNNITEIASFRPGTNIEKLLAKVCTSHDAAEAMNAINDLREGVVSHWELPLENQSQAIMLSLLPVRDDEKVYRGTLFVVKCDSTLKGKNAGEN